MQYYEKLSPAKAQVPEAAQSTDIAASLASEVAELKQQEGRLFNYHSTGVSGLAYIAMRADAGTLPCRAQCPALIALSSSVPFSKLQQSSWGPAAHVIHCMLQLKVPLLIAEGPGPVEIVTALAEDVQKAKQCKCRSASRVGRILTHHCTRQYVSCRQALP